jgi:23S rRNA (uracil1939-C5)-methyltransferase
VEESFAHIADIRGVQVQEVVPSPRLYRYRNKMEFSFSDRPWRWPQQYAQSSGDTGVALGLHVPGTFDRVIDIEGCLLQEDKGNEILRTVKDFVKESGVPVYGLKSHEGFWRYLVLRHSPYFDEWMVNIVTNQGREGPIHDLASLLGGRFSEIVSIAHVVNTRKGGTAVGQWENTVRGDGYLREQIGPYTFRISSNSFLQTNPHLSGKLYEVVQEFASLTGKETVVDLYCGIGTVSAFLASGASRVIGIDSSENSIADARKNTQMNGLHNCRFWCGDAKTVLEDAVSSADVLITDPPRTGMHKTVIQHILRLLPERIIYISCNPTTMARDMGLLKDHYELKTIQPIDLFPHTYHIEAAARLDKRETKIH